MKLLAFLPSLFLFAGAVTAAGTSSVRGKRGFQHRRLSTALTAHDLVAIVKGETGLLSEEIKLFKDELDLAKDITDTAEPETESSDTFTITADEYLPLMDMEIDLLRHEITFLEEGLKVVRNKLLETSEDPNTIELKALTELISEDIAVLNDELSAIEEDMDLILGLSKDESKSGEELVSEEYSESEESESYESGSEEESESYESDSEEESESVSEEEESESVSEEDESV
jgi:hypothetical protein